MFEVTVDIEACEPTELRAAQGVSILWTFEKSHFATVRLHGRRDLVWQYIANNWGVDEAMQQLPNTVPVDREVLADIESEMCKLAARVADLNA